MKSAPLDNLVVLTHQRDLFALCFHRWHFQRPAQAIGQGEGGFHVPGVAEVHVVKRDRALVERRSKWRIQG